MPFGLQRADDRHTQTRPRPRPVRQRAVANDRIRLVGQDVEHRREVERNADGAQFRGQCTREPFGQPLVTASPERQHRRPDGKGRLEPGDAPALLIDAHPQRHLGRERLRVARHLGHLFGRLDVTSEKDDAAKIELASEEPEILRNRTPGEADNRQLPDMTTYILQDIRAIID